MCRYVSACVRESGFNHLCFCMNVGGGAVLPYSCTHPITSCVSLCPSVDTPRGVGLP